MEMFSMGWLRQPKDDRDFQFVVSPKKIARLSATTDLSSGMGPQLNQGARGSCFPKGTLIRMADGSERRIEDVRCQDRVLTAEGNIGTVYRTMVRQEKDSVVRLQIWGHNHLRLTAEHPILTRRGYVAAGDLVPGDWVAMPRYLPCSNSFIATDAFVGGRQYVKQTIRYSGVSGRKGVSVHATAIPDVITLTAGVGRILGLFLAEGSTSSSKVVWTFGRHEEDTLVADLVSLLADELDATAHVQRRSGECGSTNVVLYGTYWAKFFESLCATGAGAKMLHPELAAGPRDFIAALLRGWLDGDGTVDEHGRQKGTTVSHCLAMSMFDLAQGLGMWPTLQLSHPKASHNVKSRRPRWDVKFQVGRQSDDYHAEQTEGYVWRKFRRKDREPFVGPVFNFSVEGDESYVAEGIGVHNCGPNSVAEQIDFDELLQKQSLVPPSRLFIYYVTRWLMGQQYINQDSGVDNRSMMKALNQYGYCPESMWLYADDPQTFKQRPSDACFAAALANRITSYAAVSQSLDQLKGTIASGKTWLFGFQCYQQIMSQQCAANGIMTMPGGGDTPVGGHDITACGYTDVDRPGVKPGNIWPAGTFKMRNHWLNGDGTPWGDGGHAYVPYDYAVNANLSGDFWVINSVAGTVPTPPDPTPPGPQPVAGMPTLAQADALFAALSKKFPSNQMHWKQTSDQKILLSVKTAADALLSNQLAPLASPASWSVVWAQVQKWAMILAPALAVPLIEGYVATLGWLTEDQKQKVDALIEALMVSQSALT